MITITIIVLLRRLFYRLTTLKKYIYFLPLPDGKWLKCFAFLSIYLFFKDFIYFLRFLNFFSKKKIKIGLNKIRNLCLYLSMKSLH